MVQDLVRDDNKTRTEPSCHAFEPCAELVSVLFQHLVCFFLLSADASFIPIHSVSRRNDRTGFSDALLVNSKFMFRILKICACFACPPNKFFGRRGFRASNLEFDSFFEKGGFSKGTISRVLSSRPRFSAGIRRMAIYLGP